MCEPWQGAGDTGPRAARHMLGRHSSWGSEAHPVGAQSTAQSRAHRHSAATSPPLELGFAESVCPKWGKQVEQQPVILESKRNSPSCHTQQPSPLSLPSTVWFQQRTAEPQRARRPWGRRDSHGRVRPGRTEGGDARGPTMRRLLAQCAQDRACARDRE